MSRVQSHPTDRDRTARTLDEDTVEMAAAVFRVLADPTRIRLIEALNDCDGATVSALTSVMRSTQQNVSRQLGVLHRAGMVSRHREGAWVRYRLTDWTGWWLVERLAAALSAEAAERS